MPQAHGIYYAESNTGGASLPPVVLIHGAGSSHLVWPAELRRLKGWRVLTLDLPGHGKSHGVALHAVADYAAVVEDFLSSLNLYRAILIGHSLGGCIALEMALKVPARVAALGILSSGACLSMPRDILDALSNPSSLETAYQLLEKSLFGPAAEENTVNKALAMLRAVRPGVLYGDWTACDRFDRSRDMAQISCPTWVGVGGQDRLTPPYHSRYLSTVIPHAELEVFPAAGHMLLLEEPAPLARSLADFLRRFSGQPAA